MQRITVKVSAAAVCYLQPSLSAEEKRLVIDGGGGLPPLDAATVLFYFAHDTDLEVAHASLRALRAMTGEDLLQVVADPDVHPRLLHLLARWHATDPTVAVLIARHPDVLPETRALLETAGGISTLLSAPVGEATEEEVEETEEEFDQESAEAEYESKYQMMQHMGVADKIKVALTGDKEWRNLLIKDANKLVSSAVVKNPRITDAEVLTISKSKVQNDEIIRLICMNREWLKNYAIRKALAENSKTPLQYALRFVSALTEKDLSGLAKSKNVSAVIASQARKLLSMKKKD